MDTEVIIALVAALSALAVASATGMYQILHARTSNRLQRETAEEDEKREREARIAEERRQGLRAISKAIQHLQDEILLLTRAAPKSLLGVDARNRMTGARDEILEAYREYHYALDPHSREGLLIVREKAADVVLALEIEGVWKSRFVEIKDEQRQELERTSHFLSIQQQQLLLFTVLGSTPPERISNLAQQGPNG
jgi:hypothetical protein